MDTNDQPDLFEIHIDNTAKYYINRFYSLRIYVIVPAVIMVICYLTESVMMLSRYGRTSTIETTSFFYLVITPVYLVISSVFGMFQLIYYIRFGLGMKQSLDRVDMTGFNRSFKLIYLNALLFVFSSALSAIITIFNTVLIIRSVL